MKNKNLRRLSVLVNSQTEYHLYQLAQMAGYKEIGRVIDKLVREKMIALKGGSTDGISRKIRAPEDVSSSGNQMQKCVEKMCAIKDELAQETANLQQSKHQIEEAIRSLEDKTEQDVLWYYYIKGMTFERIAVEMNYSWRQINRKHKSAMKKIKMS